MNAFGRVPEAFCEESSRNTRKYSNRIPLNILEALSEVLQRNFRKNPRGISGKTGLFQFQAPLDFFFPQRVRLFVNRTSHQLLVSW